MLYIDQMRLEERNRYSRILQDIQNKKNEEDFQRLQKIKDRESDALMRIERKLQELEKQEHEKRQQVQ